MTALRYVNQAGAVIKGLTGNMAFTANQAVAVPSFRYVSKRNTFNKKSDLSPVLSLILQEL